MSPELAKYLPYILGTVGVLIVGLTAGVVVLIKDSWKKKDPSALFSGALKQKDALQEQLDKYKEQAGAKLGGARTPSALLASVKPPDQGLWTRIKHFLGLGLGKLDHSFKEALQLLKEKVPGRDFRYRVPWFVMVGESGCGKTTLLDNVGLPNPLGHVGGDPFAVRNPVNWWFFTNGIVLDVDGSMIASQHGATSDDGTWRIVLSLIRRNRPERPVDGFLIAIPAEDLIGPAKLSPEDLRRKADLLYEKIWHAQKATGMTFPVYVFVTKCDCIPGFRSFVHELPEKLHDDIFGWSNPYSVHSAYIPEWVDEAFADLNKSVYKLQLEIFSEHDSVEDSDGVFLFPSEFQSLIEPLRVYLNHLFKESTYHESFLFRGVYFSGDPEHDAPVSTQLGGEYKTDAAEAVEPKPIFLKHVFEKKIFSEFRLARPVFRSVLARNRWALAGQLACVAVLVFGSLALWLSRNTLQREVAAFDSVLKDVERDLTQIRDFEKASTGKVNPAVMLQQLQDVDPSRILTGLQEINSGHLRSVWLPSSWLSNLDDRMDRMLILTFNKVVLGSIYLQLNERIQQTLTTEPPTPDTSANRVTTIAAMPEFQTLRHFVDHTKELEQYIDMYNLEAAPNSADLVKLGNLVKYIYDTTLPPAFYQHSDYYFRALQASQAEVIRTDKLKTQVVDKQNELAQRFFDALSARELPIEQLDEIENKLDSFAQQPTTENSDPEQYRSLMTDIDQLNQTLSRPELAWVGKPAFDGGQEYSQLLDAIQNSSLFGPAARSQLESMGAASFESIRNTLQNYSSSLTGPLVQISDNALKPSLALLALRKGLDDFLNQRFMVAANGRRIRTSAPQGFRFVWDTGGLQQAMQMVEPYNTFAAGGLSTFPAELQNRLRLMALNRLEANMDAAISNSQRVEAAISASGGLDQNVQNETKQLKDVEKPLGDLLAAFDRLGMTRSYGDLSDATSATAFQHLRLVDQLFDQKAPYSFDSAGLERWQGTDPLAAVVFGVKDEKDLPQYLDAQRDNLKQLRDEAEPALLIIGSQRATRRSAADTALLAKWQDIATELEKYDSKNPANSVAALESFIGTVLPTLTPDDYMDKISAQDLTAQSSDFFLNKRNQLRSTLYERLDIVGAQRAVREYRELETNFNQKLAGKFPFVPGTGRGADADDGAIRDFFKLFDSYNKSIAKYLERPSVRNSAGTRVLEFLDELGAVRSLFAPYLDDPKAVAPLFDYEVEFRVNRRRESGGNQIIEWQLQVGDHTITERDTNRRGRWLYGDAVSLSLRWAKDANIIPAPENTDGVTYGDKKVTFEDTSRWSILRMLRVYASAPADFDQLVDTAPQTLRFIVPTQMAGDDPMQTKVFVRITLLTSDKKDPITLPAFPDRAPAMDR